MADPNLRALTALCRLRRMQTDTARRDLGDALAQEATLADADAALTGELDAARQVTGDFDRDAFAAWLVRMLAERGRLAGALRQAEARTAIARAALATQRVTETASEEALAREVAEREAVVQRREQLVLEDVARALKQAAEAGKP